MSVPAISPSIAPMLPFTHQKGKLNDRTVTTLILFGGITSVVMLIASAVLMLFSLLIAGFAMMGFTALAAVFSYRHNVRVLRSEVIREVNSLNQDIDSLKGEIKVLQEEINELRKNQITPASLMERLGVLEKEFLNRGRYKYIDETPGPDDVPLPSSAASSASPPISSDSLAK
jgi:hypothetical protein